MQITMLGVLSLARRHRRRLVRFSHAKKRRHFAKNVVKKLEYFSEPIFNNSVNLEYICVRVYVDVCGVISPKTYPIFSTTLW